MSETVGGTTTKFLVDDKNPTGYSQVMDEIVNGSVTRTYTYGRQLISENQLAGSTWTPSFYGYDGHGNARFLANTAGTITDSYTFDAFGAQIASTGTTPNPYLYSGERFDSALNLYHLRARYYNMLTGRFETMDPARGNIFSPGTLHSYVYTRNNSVNLIDPTGLADTVEYGEVDFYDTLTTRGRLFGRAGEDMEFHHVIPKRFACLFGVTEGLMIALAVDARSHDALDYLWNSEEDLAGEPCEQDIQVIKEVLMDIHSADPDVLASIDAWLKTLGDVGLFY